MGRPRVLLADDHTMVAEGIESLLGEDFELVGSVRDGHAVQLGLVTAPPPPTRARPPGNARSA
jgi:hypothetical protein